MYIGKAVSSLRFSKLKLSQGSQKRYGRKFLWEEAAISSGADFGYTCGIRGGVLSSPGISSTFPCIHLTNVEP